MSPVAGGQIEDVIERCIDVDIGGQSIDAAGVYPGHVHHQRCMTHWLEVRNPGFTEDITLAEIVAVIRAENDDGVVPESVFVHGIQQFTKPVIDHAELGAVVRAHVVCLACVDHTPFHGFHGVRWPDDEIFGPIRIVFVCPGFWRIERLMGIKFVDEEHEPVVKARVLIEPVGRGLHGTRPGKIKLLAKPGACGVVTLIQADACR